MLALELPNRCEAALEDILVDSGEVALVHLKLAGTPGDEVSGGQWLGELGDEKHGQQQEEALGGVRHAKGGVSGGLANGGTILPKDVGAQTGHFKRSPSHTLTRGSQIVRFCHSTTPFAKWKCGCV